ncbi:MAG: hypothetical protein AAF318_16490 [Pseudomonadota bacterium]
MRFLTLVMAAALLAGCQSARLSSSGIAGDWASTDGVFVAQFANGAFTSRLVTTGETVVADGRYEVTGQTVALAWTSIAANEQRSANCVFGNRNEVTCTPSVGNPFTMTRQV